MLSVILYGRNDQHEYNYQKRLAMGLNCIAELLTMEGDEILFVDYNSANDEPTVIEVLQDTLTERAKGLIRTIRVRPSHHEEMKSSLPLLEPVARNVALRRSNPKNKWVLSTNGDMLFVPVSEKESLSEIVSGLPEGFYLLPRFELPENLWELGLDRMDPQGNIAFLKEKGTAMHLNTMVRRSGFLAYDNPGDFQLMLRRDIFHIGGFDEKMRSRWHVDANLCRRMSLLRKQKPDQLENRLWGYHCNHTRKDSLLHKKHHSENDWSRFVGKINAPMLLDQKQWGLEGKILEEIRLDPSRSRHESHTKGISSSLQASKVSPELLFHASSYNQIDYASARVFPHLVDHFCNLPEECVIAYMGYNQTLLSLIRHYFSEKKWKGKIVELQEVTDSTHPLLWVFDFGFDLEEDKEYEEGRGELKLLMKRFIKIVRSAKSQTKFIGINVLNTDFRALYYQHLHNSEGSFASGVVYGYAKKKNLLGNFSKQGIGLKRRLTFLSHYLVTRHLFNQSDKIRSLLHRTKLLDQFFKY
ncbi:MAG: hypothetical protein ACHQT8_04875 [Chlamydiales bacterium]